MLSGCHEFKVALVDPRIIFRIMVNEREGDTQSQSQASVFDVELANKNVLFYPQSHKGLFLECIKLCWVQPKFSAVNEEFPQWPCHMERRA